MNKRRYSFLTQINRFCATADREFCSDLAFSDEENGYLSLCEPYDSYCSSCD